MIDLILTIESSVQKCDKDDATVSDELFTINKCLSGVILAYSAGTKQPIWAK